MDPIYELRKKLEYAPVQCPECGETSDSIKSYTIPDFTFLFVASRWRHDHHVACAKCMRKKILSAAAIGLIKANVMWPIFYLPRLSVNLTRTFIKGHSEDIITELQYKVQQEWK